MTPVHGTAGEDDSPYIESSEQKLTTVRERFREREGEERSQVESTEAARTT